MKQPSVLAYIPARGGSKRIKNKNLRIFGGKSLLARSILQAKKLTWVDRVVVDTDSPKIASVAKKYKAEVPYIRPAHLAGDKSKVVNALLFMLTQLKKSGYVPDYVMILQTTSPLRELKDLQAAWKRMKKGDATSVVTVAPNHPQLYHIGPHDELVLANKKPTTHSNTQAWPEGYILNGSFVYIIKTSALLKEKKVLTKKTRAVVCPRWRSVDLDVPEDWVVAELLEKNKKQIERSLKTFK